MIQKPMRRSGFASQWQKRPEPVKKVARLLQPIRQLVPREVATLPVCTPKFDYVRSKPLLEAFRILPCQNCGADDGTVAAAHSNWAEHGHGRGIKASDVFCASLCFTCHGRLDQGSDMTGEERRDMWDAAHKKSVQKLVILRRWPLTVDVPRIGWPE